MTHILYTCVCITPVKPELGCCAGTARPRSMMMSSATVDDHSSSSSNYYFDSFFLETVLQYYIEPRAAVVLALRDSHYC